MADDDDATGSTGRPQGPLGVDPLHFSIFCFGALVLFVLYLLFPRALRKQYFGGYPKRHAWSARSRARRGGRSYGQVRYIRSHGGVTDFPMVMVPGFGSDRYLALKGLI
jgi:hypothetical protein